MRFVVVLIGVVLMSGCTLPDVRVREKRMPLAAADSGASPSARHERDGADAGDDKVEDQAAPARKRPDAATAGGPARATPADAGAPADTAAAGSGGAKAPSSRAHEGGGASGTMLAGAGGAAGTSEPAAPSSGTDSVCEMLLGGDVTADCRRCSCEKCNDLVVACYGGDEEDAKLCVALQRCAIQNQCASETCYCGTQPLTACIFGSGNGPCRVETEAAAKTTLPGDISVRSTDPNYPLGRANVLAACERDVCAQECGTAAP